MASYYEESLKDERKSALPAIEPLQGSNYREWALAMTMVLRQKGLANFINEKPPELNETWDEDKKEKFLARRDAALATIFLGVHSGHRGLLEGHNDPRAAWMTLQALFEPPSRAHIAALRNEYMALRYKETEGMALFISKVENAVRRLKAAGKGVDDAEVAYHLIANLPADYESVVNTVYLWTDEDFTTAKVKAALLAQYGRLHEQETLRVTIESSAFSSIATQVHRTSRRQTRSRLRTSRNSEPRRCYECHEQGHFARDCPNKLNTRGRGQSIGQRQGEQASTWMRSSGGRRRQGPGERTTTTTGSGFCGFYVAAYLGEAKQVQNPFDFTLDTASTHHIVELKELFVEYKKIEGGKVRFGTQDLIAEGIGKIKIQIVQTGKCLILTDVLHVPGLDRRLLSWKRLDDMGCVGQMANGEIVVTTKSDEAVFSAYLNRDFYVVSVRSLHDRNEDLSSPVTRSSNSAMGHIKEDVVKKDPTSIMAWHARLAHANCKTIKEMSQNQMVCGLNLTKTESQSCEACISAKSKSVSHSPIGRVTTQSVLELVHSDVWGPAPVDTYGGGKYFVSFIDDFSREAVVYVIRNKKEVYTSFLDYVRRAERFTGRKLKKLRTDNGMEYCSKQFGQELDKLGIKHERTNVYSPAMNGVAERFNRTALEAIRAVLAETGLPNQLWGELLMATTYVRNRILHATTNQVPAAIWLGRVPSIRHLKCLGCLAYVHLKQKYRNKLQPRMKKGVLIGYAVRTKGYRIWYPNEGRVIETIHVAFDENRRGVEDFPMCTDIQETQTRWTMTMADLTEGLQETELEMDMNYEQRQAKSSIESTSTAQVQPPTVEVPTEWRREVVERKTGNRRDIYYYPASGERLRSARDVQRYCEHRNLPYDAGKFDWTTKTRPGPGLTTATEERNEDDPIPVDPQAYRAEIRIPTTFEEATSSDQAIEWERAMEDELKMMEERDVWLEVERPKDTRSLGTKWIYSTKADESGNVQRFKARLVAQGQRQREGIDYEEVYSPVINFPVIRLFIILLVVMLGWETAQIDIKCAYLYGKIDAEIYLRLPKGYRARMGTTTHLKLNKALYGLHQSGRLWHEELHERLLTIGFVPFEATNCVYVWGGIAVLLVYVDDMVLIAKTNYELERILQLIESIFDVKRLGRIHTFLGISCERSEDTFTMDQRAYIEKCAQEYGEFMEKKELIPLHPGGVPSKADSPAENAETESKRPYRELLGCLSFVAQRTRPDLAFPLCVLAQFSSNPGLRQWNAVQQVLRYTFHSADFAIRYTPRDQQTGLVVYVDADWGACVDDRKSMTGYLIYFFGNLLSWRTIKQKCIALSSMEAEFVALSEAAKEVIWLKRIIQESEQFGIAIGPPVIYCDSQAAIAYSKSNVENQRNRHIDLRYCFVKDLVQRGEIEVRHVPSKLNIADIMTKALPRKRLEMLREDLVTRIKDADTKGEM